jgi:hypothetical protein
VLKFSTYKSLDDEGRYICHQSHGEIEPRRMHPQREKKRQNMTTRLGWVALAVKLANIDHTRYWKH